MKLTRAKFEALVEDLIQKTVAPCAQALKDAERAHAENQFSFVLWDIAKKKLRDGTS